MRKARLRTHLFWAVSVVTPWCLGAGLLVSFTADAGQETPAGASRAPQTSLAAVMPKDLAPAPRAFASSFGDSFGRGMLHEARLVLGAPDQLGAAPDEAEPRADLKKNATAFPQIDRSHRGDPLVGLRPTIDGRLQQKDGLKKYRAALLAFDQDSSGLASSFSPGDGGAPGPDSVATFEAWPDGESPVTQPSAATVSPNQGGATLTMRPAAVIERTGQGASPAVPRAVALGSSTPFAADQTPVAVLASALAPRMDRRAANSTLMNATLAPRDGDKRDYLALIPPEKLEAEKYCLAQAIYFEARSEPESGQAAVAQVILNRMTSGLYPASICGVVFQNRQHYRACQFSFACDGRALRVRESESWSQANRVAEDVLGGRTWVADVGGSTHYHANYVRPRWARSLKKMDVIGKHIFYRLKSG